ncbi:MAG: hypothetical protein R3F15_09505 [Lysobacterales bacterium]
MKRTGGFWFAMVVVGVASASQAWATNYGDLCKDILQHGIYEVAVSDTSHYESISSSRAACSEKGLKILTKLVLEGVPIEGGFNQHKSNCENLSATKTVHDQDFAFLRKASQIIVDAWSACMKDRTYSSPVRFGAKQESDLRTVELRLTYQALGGTASPKPLAATITYPSKAFVDRSCQCVAPKTTEASDGRCAVEGSEIRVTVPHGAEAVIECGRNTPDDFTINLATEQHGSYQTELSGLDLAPRINARADILPQACREGGRANSRTTEGTKLLQVELWNVSDTPVLHIRSDRYGRDQLVTLPRENGAKIEKLAANYPVQNPKSIVISTAYGSRSNGVSLTVGASENRVETLLLRAPGNANCYQEGNYSTYFLNDVDVLFTRRDWTPWSVETSSRGM